MIVFVVELKPVAKFKMRNKIFAPHRLTGFSATKLQHPAVNRRAVEIVIKADHAKRFGSRDIQRVGNQRDRGVVDVAELLLQIVQDRQRGAWRVALTINERLRQTQIKGRSAGHNILPGSRKDALRGVWVQIERLE